MQEAFGYVIFGVVIVGALIAVVSLFFRSAAYDQIGRGAMSLNEDGPGGRAPAQPGGAVHAAERDAEIRQMLVARNARRAARGEAEQDVESELAALNRPAVDPGLREEIRALVVARNHRRVARGREPLDVESEIERQITELSSSADG